MQKPAAPDFEAARFHMVESQIRPNKVRDPRILDIFAALPRENFVPRVMAGLAYIDEDLQVAPGRYLLEPMILARLLEEARITSQDRVLDVAPATGYSSGVLAALAREVVALESDPALQKQIAGNLEGLKIRNVEIKGGPFAAGCAARAPYDAVIVNGGIEISPDALLDQLAEGGRLLAVMRQYGPAHAAHTGEARLYEKIHGHVSHRALFDANVRLLPGFEAKPGFVF